MSVVKIQVRIKPNSRHDEGIELVDSIYEVRVKAPAVEGRANERLIELVAGHFKVSRSRVEIVRGHRSRLKTVAIAQ